MATVQAQTNGVHAVNGTKDSAEKLISELPATNTLPLWAQMAKLNPPLPNPTCIPYKWEYEHIKPYLLRAGNLISEKQAERRVLMLINPARDAPYTTDTVYAGLQLVMPGETAPAHRHVAFAMRFIIEGQGGFTAVHGKRIKMQRGDVILTPTWYAGIPSSSLSNMKLINAIRNWHDHGKDQSGPMIWLDGLDLPLFRHFPVHFVEHFKDPRYPAEDIDTSQSPIVFPWTRMKADLDGAEGNWASRSYLKANGQDVSKTLGGSAERLDAGNSSPATRETASSVYHVIEGSGSTDIDGQNITWTRGDTFCIPSWM
ncbi:hypothetical protein LTS18_003195, partial [Coniosporium uncinatum]